MSYLVFDIEADDLLDKLTTIHCLVIKDLYSDVYTVYDNAHLLEGWQHLCSADRIIAHNGVMYDIPALDKYLSVDRSELPLLVDTILLSRLTYPDRQCNPVGGHSLEDWGRYLGIEKKESPDFTEYSDEMVVYCKRDCEITGHILLFLMEHGQLDTLTRAVNLEHVVACRISEQIRNGFGLDLNAVNALYADLLTQKQKVVEDFHVLIPPKEQEMKTPAYWLDSAGNRYTTKSHGRSLGVLARDLSPGPKKIKKTYFNPGSRQQFAQFMKEKYKWKPSQLTETGKAQINETVLSNISYPEARLMETYLLCDKRLSQLSQWLEYEVNGRLHGNVITNGCVTGRMSHSSPNMAQIPRSTSPYGPECRACFIPTPGLTLVGADASGLELRMLSHELYRYDKGDFVQNVLEGDIHTYIQNLVGLDSRDQAKTLIYAYIYGAGNKKIGTILGYTTNQAEYGENIRNLLETKIPALPKLKERLSWMFNKYGYLRGLDNRILPIRNEYQAVNTLIQSHGAVLMKQALCVLCDKLETENIEYGLCANIHDEWQVECPAPDAETVGTIMVESIREAGNMLHLHCPMDGEFKIGRNWQETH